jgi:hypothetical protein
MVKEGNFAADRMALRMALTAVRSGDLSSLRIHQKGVVAAHQPDGPVGDWGAEGERCPAVERSA